MNIIKNFFKGLSIIVLALLAIAYGFMSFPLIALLFITSDKFSHTNTLILIPGLLLWLYLMGAEVVRLGEDF